MERLSFIFSLLVFSVLISCKQNITTKPSAEENPLATLAFDYPTEKTIAVDSAAVVSAHPLASEVGKYILKQGGNAVDAAIAVQYALAVVYPGAGNIGGGGFMVLRTADGETTSFDFRETAPSAADKDMYLDEEGNVIPGKSLYTHHAVGIPGTVAGAYLAHEKYGKISMDSLLAPAIRLAEKGFVLSESEAENLTGTADKFKEVNTSDIVFASRSWKKGDTLIQKDLAETLKRIVKNGAKEFYEGETAQLIVDEMKRGEGLITMEDLKNYKAKERKPIQFDYKNHQVITMGLPSSGGLMLQMMLTMLDPYDLADMGYHSPEAIHHVVEVERRAYADRTDYMGDSDFVDVPVERLLDKEYLKSRMADFTPGKAGNSEEIKAGLEESEQTTHLSILDKEGNAVAVTTTLNTHYGSKIMVGGAGFLLNNEMDDFSAKPGEPNEYGLLGTEANKIEPNKRPVSSMMPTIVAKDNKPFMVVGTPGGSTIITSVLQSVLNVMEFGLSAEDAVNNPKYHHQWQPDVVFVEKTFPKEIREKLEELGYKIEEREAIGRTEMIIMDENGKIHAVADKRGDDGAAGY